MSLELISQALRQNLEDANLGYPITIENAQFDSENIDLYLAPFVVPVDSLSLMKESDGQFQQNGFYQVSIYGRVNDGWANVYAAADAVRKAFPYNGSYTKGPVTVTSMQSTQNQGRNDEGRFIVDVTIDWFSYIDR